MSKPQQHHRHEHTPELPAQPDPSKEVCWWAWPLVALALLGVIILLSRHPQPAQPNVWQPNPTNEMQTASSLIVISMQVADLSRQLKAVTVQLRDPLSPTAEAVDFWAGKSQYWYSQFVAATNHATVTVTNTTPLVITQYVVIEHTNNFFFYRTSTPVWYPVYTRTGGRPQRR